MSRRPRKRGEAGFSLVESLASLLVVGMIGLMLISGITTGRRVWERMDARAAGSEQLETAQIALRDRVEQAFPLSRYDTVPTTSTFDGGPREMTFLANPSDAGRPAPLRRYTLWATTKGALVLSSISDVGPPEGAVVDNQVLLTGIRGVDIRYYGRVAQDGRGLWRGEWRNEPKLPDIVRIHVDLMPSDRRWWPDLMIRPRATIDSGCLLDRITHHCKGRA
jgi:type II secretory pathway pseudopilin PulG